MPVYQLSNESLDSGSSTRGLMHLKHGEPAILSKVTYATSAETFSSEEEHSHFRNHSQVHDHAEDRQDHEEYYRREQKNINHDNEDWDHSSAGSQTCGSRTINTNLEGIDYLYSPHAAGHQVYPMNGIIREGEPSESFSQTQSSVSSNTPVRDIGVAAAKPRGDASSQTSSPLQSYVSSDSGSSWEGSACSVSRDVSLLDSADSRDDDETYYDSATYDDGATYDEDYYTDDSDMDVRETMQEVLKNLKNGNCNLDTTSNSFDDDTYSSRDFLPSVQDKPQSTKRKSKSKSMDDAKTAKMGSSQYLMERMSERMSALGEEFIGSSKELLGSTSRRKSGGRNKGKSPRSRDKDPANKIIESFVSVPGGRWQILYT
jgi:hypothetical protein